MIEALLCDIDGTLLDSNELHSKAWEDTLALIGIAPGLEPIRGQMGKGGDQMIPVFVPWWQSRYTEEPLKSYRKEIFRVDYLPQVKPFAKVREFIERVQQAGIKLSLASSASTDEIQAYKKIAHIDDLIEEQTSSDDAKKTKPHPDIFLAALTKLKVKPENALALGDTPYDAEAAGKAGVWTIGVMSGGWTEKELLGAGCVEVYKDVADLLEHFDQSALMRF